MNEGLPSILIGTAGLGVAAVLLLWHLSRITGEFPAERWLGR